MKTAMILAAGRGERLRPLTDSIPKAMCQIRGKPLIEYHVQNLAKAGFKRIIINHAHLGDQIRHYLQHGARWNVKIVYSPEPPGGLETGGGIFNALPLLGSNPFLTVNADIYTDFKFHQISLPEHCLAHLILINNPSHNPTGDFCVSSNSVSTLFTFAGIACYHPDAFKDCRPGRYSVTPLLKNGIKQGTVGRELYNGFWLDIGNAERLLHAQDFIL